MKRYPIALTTEQWAAVLASLKLTAKQFARVEGRTLTLEEVGYQDLTISTIAEIEAAIYPKEPNNAR